MRRLLPGIPTLIVHLAQRMQGFYVAREPKGIQSWEDLTRPDVRFINREKGCGTGSCLTSKSAVWGLDRRQINGYEKEEFSPLLPWPVPLPGVKPMWAWGTKRQPCRSGKLILCSLQKERYELVMKKEDMNKPYFQAVLEILQSPEFKKELQGLGDYDLTDTGKIVADV